MSSARSRGTGQSSTQSTGTRNVSRPSDVEHRRHAARTGTEEHHPPRPVRRLDEISVAGVLDRAVGAAVAEDRDSPGSSPTAPSGTGPGRSVTACPRSVPPSAMRRYHQSPRRKRCGASGNCRPVPGHASVGPSSTSPVRSSIRNRWMPPPEKWTQQLPSSSQARSGSMPGALDAHRFGPRTGRVLGGHEEVHDGGAGEDRRDHPEAAVVVPDGRREHAARRERLGPPQVELGRAVERVAHLGPGDEIGRAEDRGRPGST